MNIEVRNQFSSESASRQQACYEPVNEELAVRFRPRRAEQPEIGLTGGELLRPSRGLLHSAITMP